MADVTKKYVDYAGLTKYDELIKAQILSDAADAAADAVANLDTDSDVGIASQSGKAITITGSIKEEDGIIDEGSAEDITLADVASTGAAEDVTYDNTTSGLNATDLQAAVDEVAAASSGGVASKTIWLHDDSAGQSAYAKVYNLYQGENDYVADRTDGKTNPTLKGTINIAKDKVVQSGSVVDIVFVAADNSLHEGTASGTDVTSLIVGAGTATANDAGKYIKLVLQNVTDPLYIAANDLVDVYSGGATTEATVTVNGGVITVAINKIDAAKIEYKAETSSGAGDGETVKQALTRLDGADTVTGSVSKKIKDAIGALDTSSDVAIATHNSSTGAVTFAGGISEADGVIAAGSGDAVIFTPVTESEITALFS